MERIGQIEVTRETPNLIIIAAGLLAMVIGALGILFGASTGLFLGLSIFSGLLAFMSMCLTAYRRNLPTERTE